MGDAHEHRGTARTPPRSQGVPHTGGLCDSCQRAVREAFVARILFHAAEAERSAISQGREVWVAGECRKSSNLCAVRALGALGALGVHAVINRTSRAGELRSAPSGPDDWHRVTG